MTELIRDDMTGEEILPIALAVHYLSMEFPVAMRSKKELGLRVEGENRIYKDYTGPSLEKCLESNEIIKEIPESGPYEGIPVVVVPIRNKAGEAVAAIGVFDIKYALEEGGAGR